MPVAVVRRRSHNPSQGRPETVLVADQLATAVHALPQLQEATSRTTLTLRERNLAKARRFKFNGERLTAREIATQTGLPVRKVYTRVQGDAVILFVLPRGAKPMTHAFRGEQLTARQIADRTGLSESAVRSRLMGGRFVAYGEMEQLERDPQINARFVVFMGRKRTVSAWAREFGLSASLVHNRLDRAWTIEKALTTPRIPKPRHASLALSAPVPALSPPGVYLDLSTPLGDRRPAARKSFTTTTKTNEVAP